MERARSLVEDREVPAGFYASSFWSSSLSSSSRTHARPCSTMHTIKEARSRQQNARELASAQVGAGGRSDIRSSAGGQQQTPNQPTRTANNYTANHNAW